MKKPPQQKKGNKKAVLQKQNQQRQKQKHAQGRNKPVGSKAQSPLPSVYEHTSAFLEGLQQEWKLAAQKIVELKAEIHELTTQRQGVHDAVVQSQHHAQRIIDDFEQLLAARNALLPLQVTDVPILCVPALYFHFRSHLLLLPHLADARRCQLLTYSRGIAGGSVTSSTPATCPRPAGCAARPSATDVDRYGLQHRVHTTTRPPTDVANRFPASCLIAFEPGFCSAQPPRHGVSPTGRRSGHCRGSMRPERSDIQRSAANVRTDVVHVQSAHGSVLQRCGLSRYHR